MKKKKTKASKLLFYSLQEYGPHPALLSGLLETDPDLTDTSKCPDAKL